MRGEASSAGWDELARVDPLWAVLSDPSKRDSGWAVDEFFAEGAREIGEMLELVKPHEMPARWGTALDYGCGPGRLSRALAGRVQDVTGVDVSPAMIELANDLNGDVANAGFHVIGGDGRSPLLDRTFDLVVSSNVLQHIPSRRRALAVLARLARAVGPDGVAIVQITTAIPLRHSMQPRPRLYAALRRVGVPSSLLHRAKLVPIRMCALERAAVEDVLSQAGLRVLERKTSISPEGVRSDVYAAAG